MPTINPYLGVGLVSVSVGLDFAGAFHVISDDSLILALVIGTFLLIVGIGLMCLEEF